MSKSDTELHHDSMERFIALANEMRNEGIPKHVISAGLMTASGVYATYVAAGNAGGLNASGVTKISEAYKKQLEDIQSARKKQNEERAEQQITERIENIVHFTKEQ